MPKEEIFKSRTVAVTLYVFVEPGEEDKVVKAMNDLVFEGDLPILNYGIDVDKE